MHFLVVFGNGGGLWFMSSIKLSGKGIFENWQFWIESGGAGHQRHFRHFLKFVLFSIN